MLKELHLKNYAIIDELNIDFKPGLNMLTGETGAGKSIIIDALGLVLGERASDECIRSGEDSATIEAVFDISDQFYNKTKTIKIRESLMKSGIEAEENEIIIRRQVSRSGKNRSYVNGNVINLSGLKDIGDMLVDIHGQHEHQTLLHHENHYAVLDSFGNTVVLREKCREHYVRLKSLQMEVNELINKERERMQRIDMLNFQKDEIDKADLKTDEEEYLKKEKNLFQNAERLHRYAIETYDILYSSDRSVIEKLNTAITGITEINRIDSTTENILKDVREVLFQIEDIASRIRDYREKIEFNPERLSEIDDRLAEISSLKRKYGSGIEEILKYRKDIEIEFINISKSQERLEGLTTEIENLKRELKKLSIDLASERERTAEQFESQMEKELRELKMDKVRFRVDFSYEIDDSSYIQYKGKNVRLFPEGIDRIEFFFSSNIGEDLKPLSKIASGGELSRVMLAIKNILTTTDSIPILVFDEVDAGIGGGVAEVVGEKLKKVSKNHQVFCITHLPQIASHGDVHFQITKKTSAGRAVVSIKELRGEDRVNEIARMTGGKVITEAAKRHAEEMIKKGGCHDNNS
ncbi:MAG: DNA repair protein RecN [Nitrospinota bacterium]